MGSKVPARMTPQQPEVPWRDSVLPITTKRPIPPTTAQVDRPERSSRAVPAPGFLHTALSRDESRDDARPRVVRLGRRLALAS